jgi:ABC-type transport system involved in Fe-S cluster assembly fused permease/ATPase subunit
VVTASLEQLQRDHTTLVVAHRIATMERADLIVVLRDGRIVESGSHQELMRAAGEYESLHRARFNV